MEQNRSDFSAPTTCITVKMWWLCVNVTPWLRSSEFTIFKFTVITFESPSCDTWWAAPSAENKTITLFSIVLSFFPKCLYLNFSYIFQVIMWEILVKYKLFYYRSSLILYFFSIRYIILFCFFQVSFPS